VSFTAQQLCLHRRTIALRREANGVGQAIDNADFLISLRSTLQAWRLGRRTSRLAAEREFDEAIRSARAQPESTEPEFVTGWDAAGPVGGGWSAG
jgi:hypothetical protein